MADNVTTPSTDAVAQARLALDTIYEVAANDYNVSGYVDARDALIAAVEAQTRAACAAKVADMRSGYTNVPYSDFAQGWHEACDAITRSLETPR